MSSTQPVVSDMLLTVKSREIQRGTLAEMTGNDTEASQHFLAAAHLELVLAHDYEQANETELARRSRISAATCFWRAGEKARARAILDALAKSDPAATAEVRELINELTSDQ